MLLAAGCARAKKQDAAPPPEVKAKLIQVNVGAGNLTHYEDIFAWVAMK